MSRLRNLAWDVFGVNFWSGDFLGVLLEALRIFWGFDFCPHSIIPVTWNPEYPQPWGGEAYSQEALVWYYTYTCTAYEVGTFLEEAGYESVSLF